MIRGECKYTIQVINCLPALQGSCLFPHIKQKGFDQILTQSIFVVLGILDPFPQFGRWLLNAAFFQMPSQDCPEFFDRLEPLFRLSSEGLINDAGQSLSDRWIDPTGIAIISRDNFLQKSMGT